MAATRVRPRDLLLLLLALSCGGGDSVTSPGDDDDGPGNGGPLTPLLVVQTDPADGATEVETGATLLARFNRAPDPATLTPGSFTVALGGVSLPARLIHQVGSTDVTLVAPLLPGVELDYEASIGTEVRDLNGEALAQPYRWSFRTRAVRQVVVPTSGDDGQQTSIALDETGGVHASHVGGGNVSYSTCAPDCTEPASWQTAVVDRGGRSSSIQMDATGRRHLAYYGGNNELRYATCAEECGSPASWTIATIDAAIIGDSRVSLALDRSGALHLAYYDYRFRFLKYAVCPTDCGDPANWGVTVPDLTGAIGREASLAVDAADGLHIVTYDESGGGQLDYATCVADCLGIGWRSVTVDPTDGPDEATAIAVGEGGRLHVAYHADDTGLRYATCAGGCEGAAAWQTTTLDGAPKAGEFASIAVDDSDRLYVTYWHVSGAREALLLTTCATDCADGSNWQHTSIDGGGPGGERVGRYNAVAVDPRGRIHVTYYDQARRDLRYLE